MKVGLRPGYRMSVSGTVTGMDMAIMAHMGIMGIMGITNTMSIMARMGIIMGRNLGSVSSCIVCAGRLASGLARLDPVKEGAPLDEVI